MSAQEVCFQVLKKRKLETLNEDNAVLCVTRSGARAKFVPLDNDVLVLHLYEDARLNGHILEFSLKPKDSFSSEDWDAEKRLERYTSLAHIPQGRRLSQEMISEATVLQYTELWNGKGDVSNFPPFFIAVFCAQFTYRCLVIWRKWGSIIQHISSDFLF